MKKILLLDAFSTMHVGNGALLENTIKICQKVFPKCNIDIMTADKETNRKKYSNIYDTMFGDFSINSSKFSMFLWLIEQSLFMLLQIINEYTFKISSEKLTLNKNQKKAMQLIDKSDICISLGGEMVADTFYKTLPFWLFNFWITIKKNKVFILFPQSVGPLKKQWTRKLVYLALKDAGLLAARDRASFDELLSLGINKDKIIFVPDVAIQQEICEVNIHNYFKNEDKKIIGVTISNPPHREMGEKIDFILKIGMQIEKLDSEQYKILIMPSNYMIKKISPDYDLCLKLEKRLSKNFETAILENRPYFPDEYTGLLSQLEFYISTRMHVAILATTIATPTIAVNTQHKIRGYMKNINMEHFCLDYKDLQDLYELSEEIVDNRKIIVEQLEETNKKLKQEYNHFFIKLRKTIA